ERFSEMDLERPAGGVERSAFAGDGHEDGVASFFDADPPRRGDVRLDFACRTTRRLAILQRRKAVTVDRGVGVWRVEFKILTNEEARLTMRIAAGADPANVRRQRDVARHFFPDEMKRIVGGPHIFSAAADEVSLLRRVVFDRAGPEDVADIAVALERSECCIRGARGSRVKQKAKARSDGGDLRGEVQRKFPRFCNRALRPCTSS